MLYLVKKFLWCSTSPFLWMGHIIPLFHSLGRFPSTYSAIEYCANDLIISVLASQHSPQPYFRNSWYIGSAGDIVVFYFFRAAHASSTLGLSSLVIVVYIFTTKFSLPVLLSLREVSSFSKCFAFFQ